MTRKSYFVLKDFALIIPYSKPTATRNRISKLNNPLNTQY